MTDRLPRVGVLHAPYATATLRDLLHASRDRCAVVLLMRDAVVRDHPKLVAAAQAFFEVVALPCADLTGLDLAGVTTFHDAEVTHADALATELGLPGAPSTVEPWDKLRQRELLNTAGVSRLRMLPVDSAADLTAAVAELGLPVVLKPRRGTASVGVSLLHTPQDVRQQLGGRTQWRGLLCEQLIPSGRHPSDVAWLADYVSVETVSDADGHHHVAVFDKIPISLSDEPSSPLALAVRETGDVLPTRLPAEVLRHVRERTSHALDALGVAQRVSHTELKVTASGVDIIEVNGRLGGEVARMVAMSGGPDATAAALEVAIGRRADLAAELTAGACATLYVPFRVRDGVVRSHVSRADIRRLPKVVAVDEVARHGMPRSDTGFRAAKVTLVAADIAALDSALAQVLEGIADLFAADGVKSDPWLRRLHERLAPSGTRKGDLT